MNSFSLSRSEEDHLKAIHSLIVAGGKASTNAISDRLNTKASSVTDMLKKLSEKGFVKHEPYYGAKLTAKGHKIALKLVRKHRLWETFLVSRLGFGWNEVHMVAEQLEHVSSDKLVEKLDEFLGHPAFDPHGDPIPDKDGNMKARTIQRLTECDLNSSVRIVAVENTSDALLEHLDKKGIAIGMRFTLSARSDFDGSIELRGKNASTHEVSAQVAQLLFVEKP